MAMAREQGALFWQLRGAVSLARLKLRQHRATEARMVLAPICELANCRGRVVPCSDGVSCLHVADELRHGQCGIHILKGAFVLRLARRRGEPAHRGAIKRVGQADAAHPGRLKLRD
jgi:hypothetical protein